MCGARHSESLASHWSRRHWHGVIGPEPLAGSHRQGELVARHAGVDIDRPGVDPAGYVEDVREAMRQEERRSLLAALAMVTVKIQRRGLVQRHDVLLGLAIEQA